MMFAVWTDELSVGVGIIDEQHRKLLGVINDLHEAVGLGKGQEVLDALFEELSNYITTNFSTEEEFMERYQFPDAEGHRRAHDGFTARVKEFGAKARAGGNAVGDEALVYLKDWIISHDVRIDKKLGVFLNERGVR
jgi:hemerythrin